MLMAKIYLKTYSGALVSVKAEKNYCAEIGDTVSIKVPMEHSSLFDAKIGVCEGGLIP